MPSRIQLHNAKQLLTHPLIKQMVKTYQKGDSLDKYETEPLFNRAGTSYQAVVETIASSYMVKENTDGE